MTESELLNCWLPKWPEMIVTGEPVTIEQAKEIIFRTDGFFTDDSEFSGGNNKSFNASYRKAAGLDRYTADKATKKAPYECEIARLNLLHEWEFTYIIRERIGYIKTEYVRNNWASCSFLYGPHGWCSPKGEIHFADNIGKWPSVEEVLKDWRTIAVAFPFVSLVATLMDAESSEPRSRPVVNIVVKNGSAHLEPGDRSVHKQPAQRYSDDVNKLFDRRRMEQGLRDEWCSEFARRVRAIVDTIPHYAVAQDFPSLQSRNEFTGNFVERFLEMNKTQD